MERPSRRRIPGNPPRRTDGQSPSLIHGHQTLVGDRQNHFEIGCESDNER